MKGHIVIPASVKCKTCKVCGAQPLVMINKDGLYLVMCSENESHYRTRAGIIDLDDWDLNNDQAETLSA